MEPPDKGGSDLLGVRETALTKDLNSNKMQDRTENQKAEKRNSTWTERQRERINGERSFREDREPALEQSVMSRTQALALEKQKERAV